MTDRVILRFGLLAPPSFMRPGELAASTDLSLYLADLGGTVHQLGTGGASSYTLTSAGIATALGYTPYDAGANVAGFLTAPQAVALVTWTNLSGKPTFATVATTGAYADLTGTPTLFDGTWASLTGRPVLFDGTWASLTGTPSFATVATTGAYADLTGRPTLGGAAALNVGTTAGTVAAGNDSRFGDFAQKANNLSDLANAGTARTNLGLGTAATKAASGSGGTVASVTGSFTIGHLAVFADTSGTVSDGGPLSSGTVTSVALTVPTWLSVSGSPVTTSGTLAVSASNQSANTVLAGPSTGAAATPAFRALVAADLPAGTPNVGSNQTWTAAQRSTISALTDGATITPDFNTANNFSVTLGGNRTLANPSNVTAGQAGQIVVKQDATGSRTLSFGSNYKFAGGTAPTLTTAANAVDILSYYVWDTTHIAVSSGLAFA